MFIKDLGSGIDDFVVVGRLLDAHGIKGEVKVFPHSGNQGDFKEYPSIILADVDFDRNVISHKNEYVVLRSRGQGNLAILELDGVADRSTAENLRNSDVLILKSTLRKLPEGHYYWHELQLAGVVDLVGRRLGRIESLLVTRAHPILVIREGEKEYLVPAVMDFIKNVDLAKHVVSIDPPAGLLEMNEAE